MENTYIRGETIAEVKRQLWVALPLITVKILMFSLTMISAMFVGHLGEIALAGASMATSFAEVSAFSLLLGLGSALDTLCGQAYGAKQYHLLGIHTQRAIFVLLLVSIPLAVILAYTGSILVGFRQDPNISAEAGIYARWMIPSIFGYGVLQCLVKFLQTQNNIFPMVLSSGVSALVHILVCWIMVIKLNIGKKGPALALGISYWFNVLLLFAYIKFSPSCKKTWTGFSKQALHDMTMFVKLAVPSASMVCLEYWAFEWQVLIAGLLPNPVLETSVLSISLNTSAVLFMIPFALGDTVSTRVSNELGSGRPQAARLAVRVMAFLSVSVGVVVALIMISVRNIWGNAYSNEEKVVKYVAQMMPLVVVFYFIDEIQSVLAGTARGCGLQKIGAFINLGAYYLMGVPCSAVLAFAFHLGGKGLWIGNLLGLFVQTLLFLIVTLRINWEQQASNAKDRVGASDIPVQMTLECSSVTNTI